MEPLDASQEETLIEDNIKDHMVSYFPFNYKDYHDDLSLKEDKGFIYLLLDNEG